MSSVVKVKDQSIETLRGIAILLVVGGYIIHTDLPLSADVSVFTKGLNFFYYLLSPIRMPLFTVISAYLYAVSPATRGTFKKLVSGKARRIMIPFLAVSTLQYFILSFLPMSEQPALREIYMIYVWPHQQLWFLYSIFEIFVIVGILDSFKALETPGRWFICLAISLFCNILLEPTHAFSIYGINFLMPSFILGYGFRRFSSLLFSRAAIIIYLVVAICGMGVRTLLYFNDPLPALPFKLLALSLTFSAVPLIFRYRFTIPILAKIGYYAFGIHIFNRIFISMIKTAFEQVGYRGAALQFFTAMIVGVLCAIGLQLLLEKSRFTRRAILGMKD